MDSHYSAVVEWSTEDEEFVAFSPELPGASGSGETAEDAITELYESIDVLLEVYAEKKLSIPDPRLRAEFSGQVRLRLPRDLHKELAIAAERQGVSLNTLFVSYLSYALGREGKHQAAISTKKASSNRMHRVE